MQLCVSNIAWTEAEDETALALIAGAGVTHLEIAPTRWWPDLSKVTDDQIEAVSSRWTRHGLRLAAFQAVLFGKPELSVFQEATRDVCLEYLRRVVDLAHRMGAGAIVFGSPKNRLRGNRSIEEVHEQAVPFFRKLGEHASAQGVRFCFEPNPTQYGADFGCTMMESAALVADINSPGVWLNVDAGAITLNAEPASKAIALATGRIGHFHVSEPFLGSFAESRGDHRGLACALKKVGYDGVVSIEMKTQERGLAAVQEAVEFARRNYLC